MGFEGISRPKYLTGLAVGAETLEVPDLLQVVQVRRELLFLLFELDDPEAPASSPG